MSGEIDPKCKGCDYAPQPGLMIDANSFDQVIGEVRIGDHTFDQSDDPLVVLENTVANKVICLVCRDNRYFLKYPTPFKKFLEIFQKKESTGTTRADRSNEPKQLSG